MYLKINTETFTFARVQQNVRLLCLPSHLMKSKIWSQISWAKICTPQNSLLYRLQCKSFDQISRISTHQHLPNCISTDRKFQILSCEHLQENVFTILFIFILRYFMYFSLDFHDEWLSLSMTGQIQNILGLFHRSCSGRLWSPFFFCAEQLLLNLE